jgi:hypothetical protein
MQSGQVSVWVPVVVGVLGVIGVITAQFVAAWREDRRWRREAAREDLRWSREQDRDAQNHWRDKRTDVYLEVIEVLQAWNRYGIDFISKRVDDDTKQERVRLWQEVVDRSVEAMAKLTLVAGSDIATKFAEVQRGYYDLGAKLRTGEYSYPEEWSDRTAYYITCSISLTHQIRRDLGIDPIVETEEDLYEYEVIVR